MCHYYALYLCFVYIYIVFFLDICMPLLESMLLSVFANPSQNWTFQRFARVAEKENATEQIKNMTLARI